MRWQIQKQNFKVIVYLRFVIGETDGEESFDCHWWTTDVAAELLHQILSL